MNAMKFLIDKNKQENNYLNEINEEYKSLEFSFCYGDSLDKESIALFRKARKNKIPVLLDLTNEEASHIQEIIKERSFLSAIQFVDDILVKDDDAKQIIDSLKYDVLVENDRKSPLLFKKLADSYFVPEAKKLYGEILRFLVVGVIATIADYGVYSLVGWCLSGANLESWIETTICTAAGFIVGLIVNYLFSIFWVYKDVDENFNKKSAKTIILFTIFSVIGLLLGTGLMEGFNQIGILMGIDINQWAVGMFTSDWSFLTFFMFTLFFGIKTLIVMVWNYVSRKIFIFKPKILSRINKEKYFAK